MKVIEPYFEILEMPNGDEALKKIEESARCCYKSEEKITSNSAKTLVKSLLKSGHHSVFEHVSASVKIVCDRGISHEIVRHRLCAFSQESSRYIDYSGEIQFIRPFWVSKTKMVSFYGSPDYDWYTSIKCADEHYKKLRKAGWKPQEARSVLPNSLKTEIIITTNLREWMHIFNLRCNKAAHPQIRQIMLPLLNCFYDEIPILFDDLYDKYENAIKKFEILCPIF